MQECSVMQSQRQLQLSLEAHGRYISSLIEREGLQSKLPAGTHAAMQSGLPRLPEASLGMAAGMCGPADGSGAGTIAPGTSGGMSWGQMTHVTLPHSAESPPLLSHTSRTGATAADAGQFLMVGDPGDLGPLPSMLLDTDLQAAAAVWDDGMHRPRKHAPNGHLEHASGLDEGLFDQHEGEEHGRLQRRRQPSSRLRQS